MATTTTATTYLLKREGTSVVIAEGANEMSADDKKGTAKHTGLPWNEHPAYSTNEPFVVNADDEIAGGTWVAGSLYLARDRQIIAEFKMSHPNRGFSGVTSWGECRANLEFAVAACNAHNSLTAERDRLREENEALRLENRKLRAQNYLVEVAHHG